MTRDADASWQRARGIAENYWKSVFQDTRRYLRRDKFYGRSFDVRDTSAARDPSILKRSTDVSDRCSSRGQKEPERPTDSATPRAAEQSIPGKRFSCSFPQVFPQRNHPVESTYGESLNRGT